MCAAAKKRDGLLAPNPASGQWTKQNAGAIHQALPGRGNSSGRFFCVGRVEGSGDRPGNLGKRNRRPAEGRSRQWVLPQSNLPWGSSGSFHSQGRGGLLHDVHIVRRLPGSCHLAFARPGQLGTDRPGAVQERRLGLGSRSCEAQRPLSTSLGRNPKARPTMSSGPTTSAARGAIRSTSRSGASIRATRSARMVRDISSSAVATSFRSPPTGCP